jgi:U4/U6 small nuclear ribonucleoprotein PRP31
MSALADELMADLDGLSDAGDDYNEESEGLGSTSILKRKATTDPDEDISEHEAEVNETEGDTGMVLEGGVKPAEELDAEEVQRMELGTVDDVRKVARLEGSRRMTEVLGVCCLISRLSFTLDAFDTGNRKVPSQSIVERGNVHASTL